jgi:hypothetical protein
MDIVQYSTVPVHDIISSDTVLLPKTKYCAFFKAVRIAGAARGHIILTGPEPLLKKVSK